MYTHTKLPGSSDGPVLAVWPSDKALEKLDLSGAAAIFVAPSNSDNIKTRRETGALWTSGQVSEKATRLSSPIRSWRRDLSTWPLA